MRDSSKPSGRAFVLEPGPSALLGLWFLALGLTAGFALLLSGAPGYVKFAGAACLLAVAMLAPRRAAEPVIGSRRGAWALPARGLYDLTPGPRTRVGRFWVYLVLEQLGVRPVTVLILRDQLPAPQWRALSLALRERP